jgi:hypothetical protein
MMEADNIHPIDKQQVGGRLALRALANYYGKEVVYSSPTVESVDERPVCSGCSLRSPMAS